MTQSVSALLDQFQRLSAVEKAEFLAASLQPDDDYGEWSADDAAVVAAQTFARLDAEDENDGQVRSDS